MQKHLSLGLREAQAAMTAVMEEAKRDKRPMAVAVVDCHGDLVCGARMDGVPERVLRFAIRKAYTAAVMGRDTVTFGREMRERGRSLADYGDPTFTTLQGGFPLLHEGQVIGAVGVGGNTQQRDQEIAQIAVEAMARSLELPGRGGQS